MSKKIAYLSGLFDGEGSMSITIQKHATTIYSPRLSMTLKYGNKVLDELVKEFGGTIYSYGETRRWHLGKRELIMIAIKKMQPYLRIKKNRAKMFFKILKQFPSRKEGWSLIFQNKVAKIACSLNPHTANRYIINTK